MTPLEEKVYAVIQPILGLTTIVMDQNKPRPALPYAAFKIKSGVAIKHDHYSDPSDIGMQRVSGDRTATLSVQCYGGLPVEKLNDLRDRIRLVSVMDAFRVRGLAAYDTAAVIDISIERETQIERRANLDIFIRYRSSLLDNVGIIETADITGVVDGQDFHVIAGV